MQSPAPRYPDWKAPPADGQVLIWPDPAGLLQATRQNQTRLLSQTRSIQNVPLNEIRARMRAFVGHEHDAQPLFATGHQSELYHPGVWVKGALIHAAAAKLDGQAFHLAVDTDAPKHLLLRWPGGAAPVTDDPNITSAAWCGLLAPPTPAHIREIESQFTSTAASWSFDPLLPNVLVSLRRLALESINLPTALTNSLHELDWSLGLRNHALTVSPIWHSEPFLLFAHHVMSRADNFAADYNASLREFREAHAMRTTTRPMPDLFVGPDSIEVPFWLDDLGSGRRSRPSIFRAANDSWVLQLLDGEEFAFQPQLAGWDAAMKLSRWLTATNHRLAPRALMLTTFFRLFLADQWTHGIGGGRYDQVADRLIERHFAIEAPKFSVTTATLFFPDAIGHERACVPCVRHEGHRLWHASLGARKMSLVKQIESLPRRSHERAGAFLAMRSQLDEAAQGSPAIARWRERLMQTQSQQKQEQSLFDRELFYAIQSRERLTEMIDRYTRAFSPSPSGRGPG